MMITPPSRALLLGVLVLVCFCGSACASGSHLPTTCQFFHAGIDYADPNVTLVPGNTTSDCWYGFIVLKMSCNDDDDVMVARMAFAVRMFYCSVLEAIMDTVFTDALLL